MVELKVKGYCYAYGDYGENKPEVYAFPEEEVREWAREMNIRFIRALRLVGGMRKEFIEGKEELQTIQKELSRLAEGKEKEARN